MPSSNRRAWIDSLGNIHWSTKGRRDCNDKHDGVYQRGHEGSVPPQSTPNSKGHTVRFSGSTRGGGGGGGGGGDSSDEEDPIEAAAAPAFPITFDRLGQSSDPAHSVRLHGGEDAFPDLDELRSQILLAEQMNLGGMQRLERLEMDDEEMYDFGGQEEYAKLEEWLDEDEEEWGHGEGEEGDGDVKEMQESTMGQLHPEPDGHAAEEVQGTASASTSTNQFEDDFSDFHSGPTRPSRHIDDRNLSLDPTPLLLHLQSVREELAAVGDEDERRVRAGKEVMEVMRSLGLADWDDGEGNDELDELAIPL